MIMPLAENICIKMTIQISLDMFVEIWCVPIRKSNFHAELNIFFFFLNTKNRCEIKFDKRDFGWKDWKYIEKERKKFGL